MPPYLGISWHAYQRYLYRVDASCEDANGVLLRMWFQGREATLFDMEMYGAHPQRNAIYRVGEAPNGLYYLMVVEDDTMLTLLEPKWVKRELRSVRRRIPKRFKLRGGGYRQV